MSESAEKHGIFINVEVDDAIAGDAELSAKLAEVCPVDIFKPEGGTNEENLDECVLCNLCVDAAKAAGHEGGVRIIKLYE